MTNHDTIKHYNEANKRDRLYYFIRYDVANIDYAQITELFKSQIVNEKEKYYLLCYLLISKEYCHLIINNRELLIHLKPMFKKYHNIIRYLLGYAWMIFYLEETIRKTRTEITDRYVLI